MNSFYCSLHHHFAFLSSQVQVIRFNFVSNNPPLTIDILFTVFGLGCPHVFFVGFLTILHYFKGPNSATLEVYQLQQHLISFIGSFQFVIVVSRSIMSSAWTCTLTNSERAPNTQPWQLRRRKKVHLHCPVLFSCNRKPRQCLSVDVHTQLPIFLIIYSPSVGLLCVFLVCFVWGHFKGPF